MKELIKISLLIAMLILRLPEWTEWNSYYCTYLSNVIIQYCIRFLIAYNVSATGLKAKPRTE